MRLHLTTLASLIFLGIALAPADSPAAGRALAAPGAKSSYVLPRGSTSFVIRLRERSKDGQLAFVNESATVRGEFSIAVSNKLLAADSPHWNTVEGRIRFRNKRLVTLSLVGVDAKYVRVTFQVDGPGAETRKTAGDRARPYKLARIASS